MRSSPNSNVNSSGSSSLISKAYARSNSSDVSCGICGSVGGGTGGTDRRLVTRALDLNDFPG
nr:hypothetical protein Itr_chr06CG11290 [Ipomoea trifida]